MKLMQRLNIPAHERRMTVSTAFTLLRLGLIPCIVGAMVEHWWGMACLLFVVAASTDIIDGWLARLRNEITFLGACLDAVTDKLLIVSCFATLAIAQSPLFAIPLWFVFLILFKEILLIAGACYVYYAKHALAIRPTWLGKGTMFMQVCFIMWLFACYFFHWLPIKTYYAMLGVLMCLVVASLCHYAAVGIRFMYGTSENAGA